MTSFLPAAAVNNASALANLRAASQAVGSGANTGDVFLRIDHRTGAMTFGQEGNPLPEGGHWAISVQSFRHGWVDWQDGKPVDRNMIPMMQGARPLPPGGSTMKVFDPNNKSRIIEIRTLAPGEYGSYEGGGPRPMIEFELNSIDEPGFKLTYSAMRKSCENRVRNLLDAVTINAESPQGAAGFVNPVIEVKVGKWYDAKFQKADIHHFDYRIVDWLANDGKTLLSEHGGEIAGPAQSSDDEPTPWDDGDEDLTDEERELLKA